MADFGEGHQAEAAGNLAVAVIGLPGVGAELLFQRPGRDTRSKTYHHLEASVVPHVLPLAEVSPFMDEAEREIAVWQVADDGADGNLFIIARYGASQHVRCAKQPSGRSLRQGYPPVGIKEIVRACQYTDAEEVHEARVQLYAGQLHLRLSLQFQFVSFRIAGEGTGRLHLGKLLLQQGRDGVRHMG